MPNTKIDVFLRVAPLSLLRVGMAIACIERWKQDPLANLRIIIAEHTLADVAVARAEPPAADFILPFKDFHWSSRLCADEHATTDPYVVADDDRIPMHNDWLPIALKHWEFYNPKPHPHPMFVDVSALKCERYCDIVEPCVSSTEPCCPSSCWAGPNYLSYKGAIPYHLFSGPAHSQDLEIEHWAKQHKLVQRVMKDVTSNHMGVGFSQAQPLLWGRF